MSITRSQIQVNTALSEGAAVSNFGVLDLTDSSLDHNLGGSTGGAVDNNSGELTARASIFADNRSDYGGGLYNQSVALLTNVTVSGNLARISGGGVLNVGATHSITATNLTIANNDAPVGAGIYNGSVDGIGEAGLVSLVNTIVALNGSGGDCSGPITSLGNNIDYDGTCNVDGSNIDPLIAPLADNGGSTQTHALIQGGCPSDACIVPSPAIDAGDAAACPGTDQRGEPRPFDGDGDGTGECDIGAYEVQEPPLTCTGPCGPIPTSSPTTPASPTPAPTSTPTLPFSLPATGGNAGSPAAIPFALAAAAVAGVGAAVWRVLRPTRH